MLRGEEDEEGNALPRQFETFCAILSNLLHEVPSCRLTQNGLDEELTPELTKPGMIVPSHLGTILMISASRIWSRRNALAGHDLCPPVVEGIF